MVADGETVVDVPAKLSARVRVFDTGQGRKTDPVDAHSVAVAGLRSPGLRSVQIDDATVALRLLVDRRDELGRTRTDVVNRIHQHLLELIPGGAKKFLTHAQASYLLRTAPAPVGVAAQTRHQLARELIEGMLVETPEQAAANVQAVINAERLEGDASPERISLIRRIMFMNVKDRVKLGMKGDREARGILVRDSNKIVACAVIHNPRTTEHEIENIAAMRTVSDEVLRLIGMNRAWARSYPIIHNLVRNPRCPMATAIHLLPHIRSKDLKVISTSRNVSEAVRRQAYRLSEMRGPTG